MHLRSISPIAVLVLVIASLLIAGCTTPSPTPSPSEKPHDTFLENYLTEYKLNRSSNFNINAWELQWTNNTSAYVMWSGANKSTSQVESHNETFIVFTTTQDATNYFNAMNTTAYRAANTEYPAGGAYQKTTGHAPQIYKDYVSNEAESSSISEYTHHEILQLDNLIIIVASRVSD